ncbi:hypothetical protein EX30DRAFT_361772 [Ascodesmis nigricans]|uniref:Uncharacterized protein n=1 Tax=Ascodesmis nigricans TaxID=341454 RepID=A0A4S2N3T1_9PEZI|nr:hypothetical protein EX30DRAFT_361772 [Ascodesmis nigricans]
MPSPSSKRFTVPDIPFVTTLDFTPRQSTSHPVRQLRHQPKRLNSDIRLRGIGPRLESNQHLEPPKVSGPPPQLPPIRMHTPLESSVTDTPTPAETTSTGLPASAPVAAGTDMALPSVYSPSQLHSPNSNEDVIPSVSSANLNPESPHPTTSSHPTLKRPYSYPISPLPHIRDSLNAPPPNPLKSTHPLSPSPRASYPQHPPCNCPIAVSSQDGPECKPVSCLWAFHESLLEMQRKRWSLWRWAKIKLVEVILKDMMKRGIKGDATVDGQGAGAREERGRYAVSITAGDGSQNGAEEARDGRGWAVV